MATRLNKDTLDAARRSRYNWDEWLDGSVWQAVRGEDFTCKVQSFVSQLYKAAYDKGMKIHVHPDSDGRVVEWNAYDDDDTEDNVA